MYVEKEQVLTLTGRGDSKQKAFQQIFAQVKMAVAKNNPDILLRIEPMDVEVVTAKSVRYTDRFFGLFLPREKVRYELTVKVKVNVRTVCLAEIEFTEEEERLSKVQRVLRMR